MKQVCREFNVRLNDVAIERVKGYTLVANLGDVYHLTLDILDDGRVKIEEEERGHPSGLRVAKNRKVIIQGVDVSAWTKSYERVSEVGEIDYYRIELQVDSELVSINSTYPWEPEETP